jgi:hypothetical protein
LLCKKVVIKAEFGSSENKLRDMDYQDGIFPLHLERYFLDPLGWYDSESMAMRDSV